MENIVACSLLKEILFRVDCLGEQWNLFYLRNKDGREIDFLITHNEQPALLIEVKWEDSARSRNFSFFGKHFDEVRKIQVVKELNRGKTYPDGTKLVIENQSCLKSRGYCGQTAWG